MSPFADVLLRDDLAFPKSLPQFQKLFPNDAACADYLERTRWAKGFACPYCGMGDNRIGMEYCFDKLDRQA